MAIFSPGVILTGIAPTLGGRTDKCRVISATRSADKLQTVAVDRLPVGLMYLKRQVLLISGRVHHNRSATFYEGHYALPQPLANTRRNMAHKDTWGDLKKPARQITSQTSRTRRKDHYHHAVTPPFGWGYP